MQNAYIRGAMEKVYFTLDQASALLPLIKRCVEQIQTTKKEIVELIVELEKNGDSIEEIFQKSDLPPEKMQYKIRLEELGDRITILIDEIQDKGVLVKDLDKGLVDFYSKINGEDVFLCWKLGEPEIQFWHGINEGFPGRKSLFTKDILSNVTVLH